MNKKTISDIGIDFKTVLLRADLNVPFRQGSTEISDDSRIKASLPTIQYLIDQNCKILICSHLGRPNGTVVQELKMRPVADRLSELLGMPVIRVTDCIGHKVKEALKTLDAGSVAILENLRFYSQEEENAPDFAAALSEPADIYVNDAFGVSHRAHASTDSVTDMLTSVAGFLMAKELDVLGMVLSSPARPFVTISGGAKVSDKLETLRNLGKLADTVMVGGGGAATFLKAVGHSVGASPIEESYLQYVAEIVSDTQTDIMLPTDVVVADSFSENASHQVVNIGDIPRDGLIMDIGPETAEVFTNTLMSSKTVVWNGPVGVSEWEYFSQGTSRIARSLADLTDAMTVIGGGSTADVVKQLGLSDRMSHVSTGGGATLQFLAGETLPGVVGLLEKP